MSRMPRWQIRVVTDPPFPVVAHWEGEGDDRILIIEVDEELHDRERNAYILPILRHHRQAVLPIALVGAAWKWAQGKARKHQRAATVAASATAVVAVGFAAVAATGVLHRDTPPGEAAPQATVAMSMDPSTAPPPSPAEDDSGRPTHSDPPSAAGDSDDPAPEPGSNSSRRPTPRASATTNPTPRAAPTRSTTPPDAEGGEDPPPPPPTVSDRPELPSPTPSERSTPSPAPTSSKPDPGQPTAAPPPSPTCGGLIHIDVNPLIDLCVL
ncbi:hypothetical protein [Nonomuraea turcica]|uniref:hypothetical protein n=1 Tax=Nonomuraea sp. G32 TaxID=3067274 RepID=UPI00273A971B|nr:hypothetical protein [Nonomuraea sp. G32]MDP4500995.1 hypothetical protein [Nonomuraea sp. G32]